MRDGLQVSTFSIGGVLSKPLLAYLTYGLRRNGSVFYAMKLNGLLFGAIDLVVHPEKKMGKAGMAIA